MGHYQYVNIATVAHHKYCISSSVNNANIHISDASSDPKYIHDRDMEWMTQSDGKNLQRKLFNNI